MKIFILSVLFLLFSELGLSQPIPADSMYLGQVPPGNTPVRFLLPVSSSSFTAERITISGDGKEIYYTVIRSYYPTAGDTIKCFKYYGNKWTGPFDIFSNYLAPAFSINGDTMYFQNNNIPCESFFSVRNGTNWGTPHRFLCGLNLAHYFQVTNSGNHYISSISTQTLGASDWCKLTLTPTDSTAVSLELPLCNNNDNLDFFVSRDESFMILAKNGLAVSYHKINGGWTNPKRLNSTINFGLGMWGPYVTSDNKYLFYTTGTNPNYSDTYIYWVRIDGILDSLKHTNYIPYLKNSIPNQTDTVSKYFAYTFPDSTFIDDDGNNTLTYSSTLSNGTPLPSWLNFDSTSRTFSGIPPESGSANIKVIARDNANATASYIFNLNIVNHTSIRKIEGNIINEFKLFQNFPNPFNPNTVIGYSLPKGSNVDIKLYDILGKKIATLVSAYQKTGYYELNIDMNKLNLASGIYYYTLITNELNSGKTFKDVKAMSFLK